MYKGARVLVAGGTGTIGVQVVKQLINRGSIVTVVSLDDVASVERMFKKDSESIIFKNLDLTSMESCIEAVKGQEIVLNLVGIKGSTGIGETKVASYLIPMLRFQTNLMEASFNENVNRFLFTGSVCAYPQSDLHEEENMWNGMPKQNDRIPGIAKRVGELLGEAFELEFGWDAVRVVRPSNVYGPYDDFNPKTAQVIPSLISKVHSAKDEIEVWGDGSAIRDFIYSEDVAYWMLEALEKAPSNYPINLGSGEGISVKEIAESIIKLINPKINIKWINSGPTGDPVRIMSMKRAKQVLGYSSRTSLADGLTKTIDWYKAQL
ncbi:MAG: GDP-L-fucose synthase [Actinomycetota bacterium]